MTRAKNDRDMNHDPVAPRKAKPSAPREDVLFTGWADFHFTAEQRGEYEEWVAEQTWATTLDLSLTGHLKLSLSYDETQDTFIASAFVKAWDSPNAGKMTSQRSSDSLRALTKLLWAVNFGMGSDWDAHSSAAQRNW